MKPICSHRSLAVCLTVHLVLLLAITSCGQPAAVIPTATGTQDPATPRAATAEKQTAVAVEAAQTAESRAATAAADGTNAVLSTQNAEATGVVLRTATMSAMRTRSAVTLEARGTATAGQNKTATALSFATATARALPLSDLVLDLYDDGAISKTEGKYFSLRSFSESWAYLNYYDRFPTQRSPKDFVITADMYLESASKSANWFASACGFAFAEKDADNHYIAVFTMDGFATLVRNRTNEQTFLQEQYYGRIDFPKEHIQFTLVVDGEFIMIYINGRRMFREYAPTLNRGDLSYVLVSGTNKDFGTRCRLNSVELWELSD